VVDCLSFCNDFANVLTDNGTFWDGLRSDHIETHSRNRFELVWTNRLFFIALVCIDVLDVDTIDGNIYLLDTLWLVAAIHQLLAILHVL
jgi:hypothetical protein